jgi:hypothetical protein
MFPFRGTQMRRAWTHEQILTEFKAIKSFSVWGVATPLPSMMKSVTFFFYSDLYIRKFSAKLSVLDNNGTTNPINPSVIQSFVWLYKFCYNLMNLKFFIFCLIVDWSITDLFRKKEWGDRQEVCCRSWEPWVSRLTCNIHGDILSKMSYTSYRHKIKNEMYSWVEQLGETNIIIELSLAAAEKAECWLKLFTCYLVLHSLCSKASINMFHPQRMEIGLFRLEEKILHKKVLCLLHTDT